MASKQLYRLADGGDLHSSRGLCFIVLCFHTSAQKVMGMMNSF